MADLLILFDWIAALLFAGALGMIALSAREIAVARYLVYGAAAIFMFRWIMWGVSTEQPLWTRVAVGALAGAFVLGVLPPSLSWIAEKAGTAIGEIKKDDHASSEGSSLPALFVDYSQHKLRINNVGNKDIVFWGNSINGNSAGIEKEGRIIIPGTFYFLFFESLEKEILSKWADNSEGLLPFTIYITEGPPTRKLTAKFLLLIKVRDPNLEITSQYIGVENGWPETP